MTVRELISALLKMPMDVPVYYFDPCDDYVEFESNPKLESKTTRHPCRVLL